jgi:hypothetical protein
MGPARWPRTSDRTLWVVHTDNRAKSRRELAALGVKVTSPLEPLPWGISAKIQKLYGNSYDRMERRQGAPRHRYRGRMGSGAIVARANPSDSKVDAVIGELDPPVRAIATKLRALVRATAPELRETVKWGVPVWVGKKNAICIMIYPDHLNLGFFQGARLSPKHPEVEGTGKGLRHVKVRSVGDVSRPVLAQLIREAVQLDDGG